MAWNLRIRDRDIQNGSQITFSHWASQDLCNSWEIPGVGSSVCLIEEKREMMVKGEGAGGENFSLTTDPGIASAVAPLCTKPFRAMHQCLRNLGHPGHQQAAEIWHIWIILTERACLIFGGRPEQPTSLKWVEVFFSSILSRYIANSFSPLCKVQNLSLSFAQLSWPENLSLSVSFKH